MFGRFDDLRRTHSQCRRFVPMFELLEDRLTPASPTVDFAVVNDWGSGFQGQIAINNTLPTPINNWTLTFNFNHNISNLWNGTIVSHTGSQYVLANAGYNATIAPGSTVTIGFIATPGNVGAGPSNFNLTYTGSNPPSPPAPSQPPTVAMPATASSMVVTGKTVGLSVLGADASGAANLKYTWVAAGSPPAPVTFSVNGSSAAANTVATFAKAGMYTFNVTIANAAGLTATSSVQVNVVQTLTSIVVTPGTANVATGSTKQFTAQANDQFGNALATQPAFTWSVTGGGTVNSAGVYTAATSAGSATVRATTGTLSGTATVTISAPVSNSLNATATYTKVNDWGSGFTGNIVLANQGSMAINGWTLQFDFVGNITQIWNAQIVSRVGNHYVIKDAGYNASIGAGQSVAFGFNATPGNMTASPTNYVLNNVALGGSTPTPPTQPTISIGDVMVQAPTGASTANFFHTSGNQIVDANGTPVKIAGVNWFGFGTSTYVPHGLWARNWKEMMNQMVQLGFNTIRIPYSNDLFNPAKVPNSINFGLNPDLQGLSSLNILDKIVGYAGQIGLRIILDHHNSIVDNNANEPLWYIPGSTVYTQQAWIDNWVTLAQRYAGNPTIIGADLHNEPHGNATWGDGNPATDWRLAAQTAGNAVLAANPNWLIFVEGIQTYNGQNYWWGGNLMGARDHPVTLNVAGRLVYSPHDYPASVSNQPWFSAANYPNNLPGVWDQYWGYLYRENIAPVWLGEFGSKLQTTSDQQWYNQITSYLGNTSGAPAGGTGISWTFWSWNPNSGDTGGILQDDWMSVNQNKVQKLTPIQFHLPTAGGPATTTATFTVMLSAPSTQAVTVNFATTNGTALSGKNYVAQTGTVTFAAGQTQATITVTILADPLATSDLFFTVNLTSPLGGIVGDGSAMGTIKFA